MKKKKEKREALIASMKANHLYNIVYNIVKMVYAKGDKDPFDLVAMITRSERFFVRAAEAEKRLRTIATPEEIEELSKTIKQGEANAEKENQRKAVAYVVGDNI